eukprot:GHVT01014412.1.p1 GENE.GHVT01014412.1~~GHVT01014412.1.p1  ORF type:complete len:220 (+),score=8.53 GHVT01014412.1:107-766(+)
MQFSGTPGKTEIDTPHVEPAMDPYERRNNASKAMAEKLLAGWTMLGNSCDLCDEVPLMRSNKGDLYCCGCQGFLVSINGALKLSDKCQASKGELSKTMDPVTQTRVGGFECVGEIPLQKPDLVKCVLAESTGRLSSAEVRNQVLAESTVLRDATTNNLLSCTPGSIAGIDVEDTTSVDAEPVFGSSRATWRLGKPSCTTFLLPIDAVTQAAILFSGHCL